MVEVPSFKFQPGVSNRHGLHVLFSLETLLSKKLSIHAINNNNTMTKENNHSRSYCDNEAKSTHGLHEIFT
jgi:hypothetical protein